MGRDGKGKPMKARERGKEGNENMKRRRDGVGVGGRANEDGRRKGWLG